MFFLFSERLSTLNSHIFEYKEWLGIPDSERPKVINSIEYICIDGVDGKNAFHIQDFLREIIDIMDHGNLFPDSLLESFDIIFFDCESSCLTMPTISNKKILAVIEEFNEIAPFWGSTRSDAEIFGIYV